MILERKSTQRNDFWKIVLLCLFFVSDPKCLTNAQDYRGLTLNALKQFYKRQTTARPYNTESTNTNNIASPVTPNTAFVNHDVKTYIPIKEPYTVQFPLAIPLAVHVGKTMKKNQLHHIYRNKTKKHRPKKVTDFEKAQRWRFKLIQGTDKHLKEIFIGKCWNYQNQFELLKPVKCGRLWEAFLAGFAYKEPCDVTLEDYNNFFEMIHEKPLVNKSMLWSGSRDITHELSSFNTRFTALEDTFAGYLADGVQWCGMTQEPGINYKHCPYECAKQKAFWGAAAKKMAERSQGTVYAIINGTRQHWKDKQIFSAYMMDSYMARNQVPNLNPDKVTEVRILVGHSLHKKVLERCGTFSVKELQKQIESLGIKTTCVDDPLSIRALLCLDYPKDALCQFHLTALLSE